MFRSAPPQVPMALMFAGVIPFASAAGAMLIWRDDLALLNLAALWLLVYAAVIFSFLGGVRWGAEIAKRERPRFAELGPSIIGALAGWGIVMAGFQHGMQPVFFAAMGGGILLHYIYDSISPELPIWYRKLRLWPTIGAVLSMAVAYFLLGRA